MRTRHSRGAQYRTHSYADLVIAWLCEIRDALAATGRTVIFDGPEFNVPASPANDVTTVDLPLPDDAAIAASVRFIGEGHGLDDASLPQIVAACRGMTQQQVEDRVALALRRYKALNGEVARRIHPQGPYRRDLRHLPADGRRAGRDLRGSPAQAAA